MAEGIKLNIDDLKGKKENGKAKKIDIEDLRYDEFIYFLGHLFLRS